MKSSKNKDELRFHLGKIVDSVLHRRNAHFTIGHYQKALYFQASNVTMAFYHAWGKKSTLCTDKLYLLRQ